MPLFEFRCCDCQETFETLVRSSEPASCPHCRSVVLEKLVSAPAGHVRNDARTSLPVASQCPPSDAPPCSPHCCRL
ncbi:MAG: zinc ribbon domain-containing protein [Planctomycetota bacterium]|nr:zinc ribbon domain-containing protein [Planctomycetota bacterium]MDA1212365.1 zinc ribbon domain-containing protein [Planctomycetota bacterium]